MNVAVCVLFIETSIESIGYLGPKKHRINIYITSEPEWFEPKFKILKAKQTFVNIQKSQSRGSSLLDQKVDPIFLKNIGIVWTIFKDYIYMYIGVQ